MYVKDIEHKTTSVDQEPEILQQTVSTAWVDGKHCLGLSVKQPICGEHLRDLNYVASIIPWQSDIMTDSRHHPNLDNCHV